MRISRSHTALLIIIVIIIISSLSAKADKEPNNSIDEPEIIKEGRIDGWVYVGNIIDTDYYTVEVPKNGDIIITISLISNGYINIQLYEEAKKASDMYFEIDSLNRVEVLTWEREEEVDDIQIQIVGTGEYELKIDFTYEKESNSFLNGRIISLIVIFILVGSILLIITIIFFKEIKIRDTSDKYNEIDEPNIPNEPSYNIEMDRLSSILDIDEELSIPIHEELTRSIFE